MDNRVTDGKWHGRWWRFLHRFDQVMERLVPTVAVIVAAVALVAAATALVALTDKVDQAELKAQRARIEAAEAKRAQAQTAEGRRIARDTLCGGLRGVQQAGRAALTGALFGTTRLQAARERRLRRLAARAYNEIISQEVIQTLGINAEEVLRENGTIDCAALSRVSQGSDPDSP